MEYITSLQYVVVFINMIMITSIMKQHSVFVSALHPIIITLPDRFKTILLCTICGVLPIPGRIMATNMCLDCSCKSNNRIGILSYLVSHHYYMWSPLEKTVIIPMAVLGLTYGELIKYMCIPLLIYICYTILTINKNNIQPMDSSYELNPTAVVDMFILFGLFMTVALVPELPLHTLKLTTLIPTSAVFLLYLVTKYKPSLTHLVSVIDIKTISILSMLILLGVMFKRVVPDLESYIKSMDITLVCIITFMVSFILGSSGKFAGLCVLTTTMFGLDYFVLFFMIDFSGYLLSPFHKCLPIAVVNFKTPVKTMIYTLIPLIMMLLLYGVLSTLI